MSQRAQNPAKGRFYPHKQDIEPHVNDENTVVTGRNRGVMMMLPVGMVMSHRMPWLIQPAISVNPAVTNSYRTGTLNPRRALDLWEFLHLIVSHPKEICFTPILSEPC